MSDNNGNVLSQAITGGGATRTQSYVYDPVNRLKSVTESGSQAWSQKYVYDAYGNRAIKSGSWIPTSGLTPQVGGLTHEDPAGVAALFPDNRWAAAGTDGSGNLTSFAGRTFVYDGENRLVSATVNGATAAYAYDGEGRRVRKTDAFGTTTFVYDAAGQLAAEYFAAAAGVTQPAEQEPGTRWVFADHLGSTRATLGSGGAGLKLFDYAPFGEDLARGHNGRGPEYPAGLDVPGNVAQRFTGKERDAETGLDYFGFRYMSAAQGRFTSPDPAGASAILDDPQTWNRYSYVNNRPLTYTDPDGLIPVPIIAGGIGAGTAAIGSAASQYLSTGQVDWGRVGVAAGGGFVSGATFGPVGGLVSKVITNPWVTSAVAGAVSNTLGGITARTGNALADGADFSEALNPDALESDAKYGVLGGTLGEAAGRFWGVLNAPYLPKRPSAKAHSAQSQAAKAAYNQAVRTLNDQSTGQGNSASTWFGAFFTNIFAPLREAPPPPRPVITTKICFVDENGKQVCQ